MSSSLSSQPVGDDPRCLPPPQQQQLPSRSSLRADAKDAALGDDDGGWTAMFKGMGASTASLAAAAKEDEWSVAQSSRRKKKTQHAKGDAYVERKGSKPPSAKATRKESGGRASTQSQSQAKELPRPQQQMARQTSFQSRAGEQTQPQQQQQSSRYLPTLPA